MAKVRQDAWSHEDDLLLAETVLRHIREGSTQLDAFEEVGDKLNRTGAACGFRWNAIVRKKYESAIEIAKKQRKQRKREEQRMARSYQPNARPNYARAEQDEVQYPAASTPVSTEAVGGIETQSQETGKQASEFSKELSMDQVIYYLQNLHLSNSTNHRLEKENQTLREQNQTLTQKVTDLEKVIAKLKRDYQTVEEDYQSLIGIMERARRMVLLQDQDESSSTFKMDKNGNLEKLAK